MNFKLANLLVLVLVAEVAYSADDCYNLIKTLANQDKCLSSRIDLKQSTAKIATNPEQFFDLMLNIPCNGTAFSCGNTRSWVSEVFLGLSSQFQCSKLDIAGIDGDLTGYSLHIGQDLMDLFEIGRLRNESIIYQLRHIGTEDHDWTIEQLANQAGFRVYQSYNDAFSLKAWLSISLDGLLQSMDILTNQKSKNLANSIIMQMSNGTYNLNTFDNSASNGLPAILLPYARYIRDYNGTTAMNNLQKAWSIYGQGKILSWPVMQNYIAILSNLTTYFDTYDNTATLFDETIFNNWINLFGAPDLVHFPNLPNNLLSSMNPVMKNYRFEVKVSLLNDPSNCAYNADVVNAKYSLIKQIFCNFLHWC